MSAAGAAISVAGAASWGVAASGAAVSVAAAASVSIFCSSAFIGGADFSLPGPQLMRVIVTRRRDVKKIIFFFCIIRQFLGGYVGK